MKPEKEGMVSDPNRECSFTSNLDSAAIFRVLLETLPDAIIICDRQGRILLINGQAENLFGYSPAELSHRTIEILVPHRVQSAHRKHREQYVRDPHTRPMGQGGPMAEGGRLYARRKDGSEFPVEISLGPLTTEQGQLTIGIIRDVSVRQENEDIIKRQNEELQIANRMLSELAMVDDLTGLKNKRALREQLAEEIVRYIRYQTPLSIFMLDIDHFKEYNDEFGHPAGDMLLKALAALLRDLTRDVDYVTRYGGEEFLILLPNTGAEAAVRVAERYRLAIESAMWPHKGITASFGTATMAPHGNELGKERGADDLNGNDLIAQADIALYESKRAGRNRVSHYKP